MGGQKNRKTEMMIAAVLLAGAAIWAIWKIVT